MPTLTQLEIGQFLKLFNRGGYVLDFSTNDFDVFTMQCIGVAVCSHYGMSKGKSLTAYLNEAADDDRKKLITELFAYYEENYVSEYNEDMGWLFPTGPAYDKGHSYQYKKCKEIIQRMTSNESPLAPAAEELIEKFSSDYLSKHIRLMIDMQDKNPTEAIGKAKELIESCCKTILDDLKIDWDKDWTVAKLAGTTMEQLKLMPSDIPDSAAAATSMKALLGNLLQVATRMAELRNPYGSGHGKSASYKGLEPRHAKLAVGATITFVTFLWETHERRSGV